MRLLVEEAQQQDREPDGQRMAESELSERLRPAEERAPGPRAASASAAHPGKRTPVPSARRSGSEQRRVGQPVRHAIPCCRRRPGPSSSACASLNSAQQANTIGASTNTVSAPVKITAPALADAARQAGAEGAYRGQLAIAVTPAARKASMKPCTIQNARR